jgi:HPt (histidine-containing phosphotransfer) domain-containing protein
MAQGFGQRVLKPQEQRGAKILRKSVLQHFQDLEDPRVERGQHHRLVSLVSIAILAILAGGDSFVAIERYGVAKQAWLETFLELPYGIPSHDTFGRVMAMLSPEALETRFLAWVSNISERLGVELIHIDGKTARGSYDREGQLKALHSVSAWSSEHGLVLGQQTVDHKSNEITAVPLLLKLLNLKGHGYRINPLFIEADSPQVSAPDDQTSELNQATEQIWQQVRGHVLKQVDELEDAVEHFTADSSNPETLQLAQKNAHQIAGIVGTFGYDAASHIARSIEILLASSSPWESQASLQQLVDVLRTELRHES